MVKNREAPVPVFCCQLWVTSCTSCLFRASQLLDSTPIQECCLKHQGLPALDASYRADRYILRVWTRWAHESERDALKAAEASRSVCKGRTTWFPLNLAWLEGCFRGGMPTHTRSASFSTSCNFTLHVFFNSCEMFMDEKSICVADTLKGDLDREHRYDRQVICLPAIHVFDQKISSRGTTEVVNYGADSFKLVVSILCAGTWRGSQPATLDARSRDKSADRENNNSSQLLPIVHI